MKFSLVLILSIYLGNSFCQGGSSDSTGSKAKAPSDTSITRDSLQNSQKTLRDSLPPDTVTKNVRDTAALAGANTGKNDTAAAINPLMGLWSVIHRSGNRLYTAYQLEIIPGEKPGRYTAIVKYSDYPEWNAGDTKAVFYRDGVGYSANWITGAGKESWIEFSFDPSGNLKGRITQNSSLLLVPLNRDATSTGAPPLPGRAATRTELHGIKSELKNITQRLASTKKTLGIVVGFQLGQINYSGLTSKYFSRSPIFHFVGSLDIKRVVATLKFGFTNMESKQALTFTSGSIQAQEDLDLNFFNALMGMKFSPNTRLDLIPQVGVGMVSFNQDSRPFNGTVNISSIPSYLAGYTVRVYPLKQKAAKLIIDISALYSSTDFNNMDATLEMGNGYITYQVGAGIKF